MNIVLCDGSTMGWINFFLLFIGSFAACLVPTLIWGENKYTKSIVYIVCFAVLIFVFMYMKQRA